MWRLLFALALLASACAPTPVAMPASEASEMLERFAVGAGPADICTPNGRAMLRGAVRSYGAAMAQGGEAWPEVPVQGEQPDELNKVDIAVLIAFSAGFVEYSDFRGDAQRALAELTFGHWPVFQRMHQAAAVACDEVVELQQAAGRYVMEVERYRGMIDRADDDVSRREADRMSRQAQRMQRAQTAMNDAAALVQARVEEQS